MQDYRKKRVTRLTGDDFIIESPGICGVIAGGIAASVAVSAYSANKQNKAAKAATAQQQAGIESAQQYSREAARESSELLQPLASLGTSQLPGMVATQQQYKQLGNEGIAGIKAQQGPLNVGQFLDPSMAFQQAEGQKAVQTSAAARGGLLSGATLKDLTQYSQGLASQNYNNAAQLAMNNRAQQTGLAGTLAGFGSDAANMQQTMFNTGVNAIGKQASLISGQGENAANLAMTSGNVAAAGTSAQKDVLGTALNTGLGMASAYFSDEDLKTMKSSVSDDEIDQFLSELSPESYDYVEDAVEKGAPRGRQMGIMAQDAEKSSVGKNLVEQDEDGDKMLSVPKTVSALLATSASLNKRIKKLEGKK